MMAGRIPGPGNFNNTALPLWIKSPASEWFSLSCWDWQDWTEQAKHVFRQLLCPQAYEGTTIMAAGRRNLSSVRFKAKATTKGQDCDEKQRDGFLTEFIVLLQKKAPLPGLGICNEKRERSTRSLIHFPTSWTSRKLSWWMWRSWGGYIAATRELIRNTSTPIP